MVTELLRGKVAKFLSPSKIAINIGREDGVKNDMKFIIYEEGDLIIDPETGMPLENLELVKGRIEITNVQEKISIGESFGYVAGPSVLDDFYTLGRVFNRTTRRIEINLTEEDIGKIRQPGPIVVGDLVRQVISKL